MATMTVLARGQDAAGAEQTFKLDSSGKLVSTPLNPAQSTILASAARTTAQSVDLVNSDARGVIVVVDVTVDPALASITPKIRVKDALSGKYIEILVATALAAVGIFTYIVYPGVAAAAEGVTKVVGYPLPLDWNFQMVVADADSMTYSVSAQYIR